MLPIVTAALIQEYWFDDPTCRIVLEQAEGIGKVESKLEVRPVKPVFLGYPHGPKDSGYVPDGAEARTETASFKLGGKAVFQVQASTDSFAASGKATGPVGSVVGQPTSLQFDSIYDRKHDWLLTFDAGQVRIVPGTKGRYEVQLTGDRGAVTFRPGWVRNHLGYSLWTQDKPLWPKPIAGWCSWMAHLQGVTEGDVVKATDFMAKNLRPYGYDVIQIDDGYQRFLQGRDDRPKLDEPFSDLWTKPNDKFPNGLEWLAKRIDSAGMTPGIWFGLYAPRGLVHQEGLIRNGKGEPHAGPWVNYAANGLVPAAREEAYLSVVKGLRKQGWRYLKLDTLRHVLYDSYRQVPEYWAARGESMEEAFRTIIREAKKAAGKGTYVLSCWGAMPELAGLPDGARIGEDVGPDVRSMRLVAKYTAQFQHLNNVVWLNDPDYMCLRVSDEQAEAWCTLTSLAGGHVMVSDPVETYTGRKLDALRRVGPTVPTKPLNMQPMPEDPEFMTLTGRDFVVLARFGWGGAEAADVDLVDLGLGDYVGGEAFDFWRSVPLGRVDASVSMRALGDGECQAVVLRRRSSNLRLLATDRHLYQESGCVSHLREGARSLSGEIDLGPDRAWSVWVSVPSKVGKVKVEPASARVTESIVGDARVVRLEFPVGSGKQRFRVSI